MSHLGKTQKNALRKFAETHPEQVQNGLVLRFRWGGNCIKGRRYVKLSLLASGEVKISQAARIFQEGLAKELDLSFIPDRIWQEVAMEEAKSIADKKIAKMKAT